MDGKSVRLKYGTKKTPTSRGKIGAISRPWSARLTADRDAMNARAGRRIDELLRDVAVGGNVCRRRDDADALAVAPVAMEVAVAAVAVGRSRGRDQSGGANCNGGACET